MSSNPYQVIGWTRSKRARIILAECATLERASLNYRYWAENRGPRQHVAIRKAGRILRSTEA